MPDGSTVSGVPGQLIDYSAWAQALAEEQRRTGIALNDQIEAVRRSHPGLGITAADFVGSDIVAYAVRNHTIDAWVGQVGQAFMSVAEQQVGLEVTAEYMLFTVATTTEDSLESLVGADPEALAQDEAEGAKLAAEIREALDPRALVQELAAHEGDPAFCAGFFNQLGPAQTVQLLSQIGSQEDLLRAFDTALASASNSPDFDPTFVQKLFDWNTPLDPNWPNRAPILLSLLKYGTYSEGFLSQALDAYLRQNPGALPPGSHFVSILFEALARNPTAAADYLMGPDIQGVPVVGYLIQVSRGWLRGVYDPTAGTALGDLLSAALVAAPQASGEHMEILRQIADANWRTFPDGARAGLAGVIARWLPDLEADIDVNQDDPKKPVELTWQARLFWLAELAGNGNVDWGGVEAVQQAINDYVARGPGPGQLSLEDWVFHLGRLYGLVSLPQIQSPEVKATDLNSDIYWWDQGAHIIQHFIPLPPGAKWVDPVLTFLFNWGASHWEDINVTSAATQVGKLEKCTLIGANTAVVWQLYQQKLVKVPPGQEVKTYLANLALADPTKFPSSDQADVQARYIIDKLSAMDDRIEKAFTAPTPTILAAP